MFVPAHAGLFRHVGERAIPIVVIERIFSPVGDEQVFKAVVIVVADANTGRPPGSVQSGFFGDIGRKFRPDCSCTAGLLRLRGGPEAGAAKDENVEPSVIVVVEKCQPQPMLSTMYSLRSMPP